MPCSLLPTLLLQIFVIGYTPGPANIYSLAMSLRHGRKDALVMWFGLLCGFCIAVTIMAVLTHCIDHILGDLTCFPAMESGGGNGGASFFSSPSGSLQMAIAKVSKALM